MIEQELNWEKKEQLVFSELTSKFQELSKEVVKKELFDIVGKIEMLQTMGILSSDNSKVKELREKLEKLQMGIKHD